MVENTFRPIDSKGKRLPGVEYTPMLYTVGGITHRLALHKDILRGFPEEMKDWVVSEPTTGKRIRIVLANHKGLPIASRGLPPKAARTAAVETLDALVSRIGEAHFNEVIKKAMQ
jgi:hypothetical protein